MSTVAVSCKYRFPKCEFAADGFANATVCAVLPQNQVMCGAVAANEDAVTPCTNVGPSNSKYPFVSKPVVLPPLNVAFPFTTSESFAWIIFSAPPEAVPNAPVTFI